MSEKGFIRELELCNISNNRLTHCHTVQLNMYISEHIRSINAILPRHDTFGIETKITYLYIF